jgi:Rod binding domain-containing protein
MTIRPSVQFQPSVPIGQENKSSAIQAAAASKARRQGITATSPITARVDSSDDKLKKACRDFESVLVSQMLSQMRSTVQKTDLFGSDDKEEMFRGMLDQEIAKESCKNGTFGLGDMIYAQMTEKKS